MKVRLKYLLSFLILEIAIYFNWKQIPIQDNFVKIVAWLLGAIGFGFGVKEIGKKLIGGNNNE